MTYTFSPNTLSLLRDCPRCFWLKFRKRIKRPDFAFPSLPRKIDIILKQHFDKFMRKGLLPPELAELNGEVKLFDNEDLLKTWRNHKRGIRWTDSEGNVFMGAIDNLLVKGNKLIILEYKTCGSVKENSHERYRDQIDIYNLLFRLNGYETEDYAYILFYYPNKVQENGDINFHSHLRKVKVDIRNAKSLFKQAVEILKQPMPEPDPNCQFCGWVERCRCEPNQF